LSTPCVFKLLLNTQPNSSGGFAPEGGASRSSFTAPPAAVDDAAQALE
jgi:hypothetical protein